VAEMKKKNEDYKRCAVALSVDIKRQRTGDDRNSTGGLKQ